MVLALALSTLFSEPKPVLAGYLPAWRLPGYDLNRLAPLTDVLYFSIQPNADGTLNLKDIKTEDLKALQDAKKKLGFRLHICVGGWERSDGFMSTASNEENRARFATAMSAFCDEWGLDGLDLDWEHPKNLEEAKAYGALIGDLRRILEPKGRIVTAAIAAWQSMDQSAVDGLHRVHLMSYDHRDRHSTMEKAVSDVEALEKMGFSDSKIVLGVPFYGRNLQNWNDARAFAEILAEHKPKPEADEAGGYYFNGPRTLEAKATFVKERKLAGMMIWEVAHDATGEASLLGVLRRSLGL